MSDIPYPKPIRLDHSAYDDGQHVFHIVIRAVGGTRPFETHAGQLVWTALLSERTRGAIVPIAACLMPDHVHVIVRPGSRSVIDWVNAFKSYTTHLLRPLLGRKRLWQPSFYDRRIRDEPEFEATVLYLERNPIEAGLAENGVAWPWFWADERPR